LDKHPFISQATRYILKIVTAIACLAVFGILAGCGSTAKGTSPGTIVFVHGAGGDMRGGLFQSLREAGETRTIVSYRWGSPIFLLNFNSKSIHNRAEKGLVKFLIRQVAKGGRVDVITHSAGGGVALGALSDVESPRVGRLVLLHPSVSPGFDLKPALSKVEFIDVVFSDRDTTFLKWRTSTFGTYDGVKTPAAGNRGFDLTAPSLTQHAWDQFQKKQGHDGGHFGALNKTFVQNFVAPLLKHADSDPPNTEGVK